MSDFETVFYEPSPDGTIHALVEQDERVAYFYLHRGNDREPVRACWVRNLAPGPVAFRDDDMRQGIPPVLPRLYCDHPAGLDPLENDRLSAIWFEEGDGCALLYDDKIVAVIPPWSGADGFHGYAQACTAPNQVCWPMPHDPTLANRLRRAQKFWKSWSDGNPWPDLQASIMDVYERAFGTHVEYYAIDGDNWPPRALVGFQSSDKLVLATAGVSIRPQPGVEFGEIAGAPKRIELGMQLSLDLSTAVKQPLMRLLSSMANYPWHAKSWLGQGHTYPLRSDDDPQQLDRFTRALLLADDGSIPPLPRYCGDAVDLLWVIPITESEAHYVEKRGAAKLLAKLADPALRVFDPNRADWIE